MSSSSGQDSGRWARVSNVSPASWCQFFYVLSAAGVLAVAATPPVIQRRLAGYGARAASSDPKNTTPCEVGHLHRIVNQATSMGKVPHSWFSHFYGLSLFCSLFWALQYLQSGAILQVLAEAQAKTTSATVTLGQVSLVWTLMTLQGARRLYENTVILRPSNSSMWVVHWLLANSFYFCTSISVWIEGAGTCHPGKQMTSETDPL